MKKLTIAYVILAWVLFILSAIYGKYLRENIPHWYTIRLVLFAIIILGAFLLGRKSRQNKPWSNTYVVSCYHQQIPECCSLVSPKRKWAGAAYLTSSSASK